MYPQFFGFHKLPFRLRPDPDFLYSGKEYLQARAAVIAAPFLAFPIPADTEIAPVFTP